MPCLKRQQAKSTKEHWQDKNHDTQVGLNGIQIADKAVFYTTALGLLAWPIWGVSNMLAVWSV